MARKSPFARKGLVIREESPGDLESIRALNRAAFGSSAEARLVDRLRANKALLLSLVAEEAGEVVGHIAFSPATLTSDDGKVRSIVGLAPMSVLPPRQGQGIGAALVRAGLDRVRSAGHGVVVLLGHANYYPKFGFVPASRYGLRWEHDAPDEAFMALELRPGALDGVRGVVAFRREFDEVS